MLTVGSLFSGIGGIEYGLERTGGFKTIWQCEIDAYASAVLRKHWPSVPNLGDITKVDWGAVETPDLICGGFPCQDISVAGKGAGIRNGRKSGLWSEYAKAIRILRPRWALIENVPALTFRGLDLVLADLAEAGYDAEWFSLSASEVGAWHKRERTFIIAYAGEQGPMEQQELQGASGALRKTLSNTNRAGCSDRPEQCWREQAQEGTGKRSSCGCGSGLDDVSNPARGGLQGTQQEHNDGSGAPQEERGKQADRAEGRGIYVSDTDTGRAQGEIRAGREVADERDNVPDSNNSTSARQRELSGAVYCLAESARFDLRSGEGWWATEPDVGRVANGVPSRLDRIKCLGNAVVPQVAQVIGEAIIEMEK